MRYDALPHSPEASPAGRPADTEGLGTRLRALSLSELERAMAQLAREGEARHAGVHQARKSLRRARATLALAARALDERGHRLDQDIACLCRGLGPLRDGQALVEALQRLGPSAPPDMQALIPEAMACAQARSARRVKKARRRIARDPARDEHWHALRRRLRRVCQQYSVLEAVEPSLLPDKADPGDEATLLGHAQDDALLLRHCGRRSPFPLPLRRALAGLARERLARARARFG